MDIASTADTSNVINANPDTTANYSDDEDLPSTHFSSSKGDLGDAIVSGLAEADEILDNGKVLRAPFTSNVDCAESSPTALLWENGGRDNEDSSDDELLVNRKTLKKATESKVTKNKNLKKKVVSGSKAKKIATKVQKDPKDRKRKVEEVSAAEGHGEEDEEEDEVTAAVIVNDADSDECESLDAEAIAVAEIVTKENKRQTTPGRKKRRRRSPHHSTSQVASAKVRKKPGPQPGWKKRKQRTGSDLSSNDSDNGRKEIPFQKREAAERSRDILLHSVEHLPFVASESVVVRKFGRLKEENEKYPLDVLYSSPSALYPVGYSCDRYEFSPTLGRLIKFRCEILNGSKYANVISEGLTNKHHDEFNGYDGPIFRILWGKAIDEWDYDRSIPFDLDSMACSFGANESDATPNTWGLQPESGMRVKVRFDQDTWYKGILGEVISHDVKIDEKSRKKGSNVNQGAKQSFTVQILYDDGSNEQLDLPDPDVVLLSQGMAYFYFPLFYFLFLFVILFTHLRKIQTMMNCA